ncbi:MAG: VanZ family protein [Candidatus Thiodiazotropha sp. (ex Epidulcina cf. delphinae)]|nr:VanZ family protein [Candidatus Thiodiazotropha sp. (ex Epidulcina cf. delphinae)]
MSRAVSLITLSYGLFIGWVIYMANTGQSSLLFQLVSAIPYGDKLGHLFLFGFLTLGLNVALNFKVLNFKQRKIYYGTIIVGMFVLSEELSQYFLPSRTFDVIDLCADITGILVFSIISYILSRRISFKIAS